MIKHVHILGASGSGTTTLGAELAKQLKWEHFDCDDFFWEKTEPPYQIIREREKRQNLLENELKKCSHWILTGSLCGWGDIFIPCFDLVVYLWIPQNIRLERLRKREFSKYGDKIEQDEIVKKTFRDFMSWTVKYDTGDLNIRSKKMHEQWLLEIPCKILRLEGLYELDDKVNIIVNEIRQKNN